MKTSWHLYFYLFSFGIGSTLYASPPDWTVNTKAYQGTMTVTGMIEINGLKTRKVEDIVAVFVGNECRGIAKPIYNKTLDRYFVFLSIFGNETLDTLTYKIYIAAEDRIYVGREKLGYEMNTSLGKIDLPYLFRNASATGVAQISGLKTFAIYPNPLKQDLLWYNLQLQHQEFELKITVSDVMGRVLFEEIIAQGSVHQVKTINFSGLDAGIYLVSLSNGVGVVYKKLIRY